MLFVEVLVGAIFIICGVLVKKYPNLIAGYNTMTPEEKRNIDIKKFSTFLHNGLIIIGALLIVASVVFYVIETMLLYRLLVDVIIIFFGLLYTLINAPKQ
ncbi:DUF3784 domain-containing protein [Hwangdonia lutea]|uniref:DUF3784 domain-containing protein n=1 Tax=Hwangdonia lutea TaxID=3075823 RepID=A0AA97HPK0_9FLAO|nr:DUF3784 domain-containing protein [Hwangdonia sp. SCSIO 19198]WOD43051.1 DUF3784 domain-containing protein [Hwangdonia sp. SCSIO 19198]